MTMIQKGFPTIELRDEHERGVPNAFARLAKLIRARGPSDRPSGEASPVGGGRACRFRGAVEDAAVPGERLFAPARAYARQGPITPSTFLITRTLTPRGASGPDSPQAGCP